MNPSTRFQTWEQAVSWLRTQPDRRALVRDAYYDDPLVEAAARYHASAEWQALLPLLGTRRGEALEVGAGRGIASYALAREGFKVCALEPDPSALVGSGAIRGLASAAQLPITVVEEFSENLPFADASFDLVFVRAVLHHCQDLPAACRQFYRVLKPGGRLVAIREHVISKRADLPAFLSAHPLHDLYGGENAFLLAEYLDAIDNAGFREPHVLAPLRSAINLFPQTEATLKAEIVERLRRFGPVAPILSFALTLPLVWPALRYAIEAVDNRPGRLYSFIADKA